MRAYTINGCNIEYPPSEYASTRALNYAVANYDSNVGEENLLVFNFEEYGECYAGAMVEGFGEFGDIVQVTLDDGTTFNMIILDTKSTEHTEKELKKNDQCQNQWGHGYYYPDSETVQMCVCEFVAAGSSQRGSAVNYENGEFLLQRSAISAVIIGHVNIET
ncbi:hypothetical protein [Butyrivibrio proteoclasticus]|uniref:hypothetical protein n=1 Tax=Butyrivibrio proteoclasticus TaxID=43305 RepID=UPI00047C702E|nr:hypothetical protein [Butyrivibrio proteoclasticus]